MTTARRPPAAWRVILGHARPHRRTIAAAGLLSVLGSAAALAQPLTAASLVDRLGRDEPLVGVLLLLTALVLLGAVLRALGDYLLGRTAESVVLGARRRLVGRLLRLPVPVVERTEPGDLMSRVTSDTVLLREVASRSVVEGFTGALTMVAIVVLMGVLDPVLLAVTLVVLVLTGVVLAVLLPRIRRATRRSQEAVGAVGAVLERALGALRTVKASAAEEREAERADRAVERAWSEGVRAARWNAVAGTVTGLAIQASFLAVLGVGGARVASDAIEVSTLVAFLLFLFYLVGPIGQVVQTTTQLQVGAAAVARIDEVEAMGVEDTGPAVEPRPGPPARVELRDVVFRYRDEREPVHRGVGFEAATGGVTALVGPSGAGKSTVFALLERFHEAESGEVLVDGRDVREWPLPELRAVIGYVEQDSPVLSGTLRENLLFAAPGATDADLADVLRRTRLDGLVAGLPDGLDTAVGPRGTTLSGGERQRVAIARALLRRPRLLLLDEATSQLDARNELALREVVLAAAGDATVIVVAHRLSTITDADRIVVFDAGRVRATGTHEELLRSDPLYGELAATQFLA